MPPATTPRAQPVTFSQIESTILGPKCVSCHQSPDGQAGVNLDSYAAIENAPATHGHAILEPGSADTSHLYDAVKSGDMPPGGPMLSADEIQMIRDWINEGAPNN
jgi:mono/diheme cytochrome c family protein